MSSDTMDFEEGNFASESEQAGQQNDFFAGASDAVADVVDAPPSFTAPAAVSAIAADTSPLVAFNAKFRALGEEKDAKEREAKAARRAAGKVALKAMLTERAAGVQLRKQKNREDEAAKEREMMDALEGESWGRVASLVDVHSVVASSDKKKPTDNVEPDLSRQKDILISLKGKPLPTAATA